MSSIAYPFTLDGLGVLESTSDPRKIYLDRLLTLLSTSPGQRPMLPEYGTDVMFALYENEGVLETAISQAVKASVAIWLPEISVEDVKVSTPDENGAIEVEVIIRLPNDILTTLTVSSAIFNIDGTITATE